MFDASYSRFLGGNFTTVWDRLVQETLKFTGIHYPNWMPDPLNRYETAENGSNLPHLQSAFRACFNNYATLGEMVVFPGGSFLHLPSFFHHDFPCKIYKRMKPN
jgi:hypothetical protein